MRANGRVKGGKEKIREKLHINWLVYFLQLITLYFKALQWIVLATQILILYACSMISGSDNIVVLCSKYQDGRAIIQVASYSFSPSKPRLSFGPHYLGYVVDKETMGQVFLPVILFSPRQYELTAPRSFIHTSPTLCISVIDGVIR